AAQNHYPAIHVLQSVSRLFREVTTPEHRQSAQRIRQVMATYQEVSDLIQMGMYQKGASPQIDEAIQMMPKITSFLRQEIGQSGTFEKTIEEMAGISR
ncbi:MAG TPA: EscN/YscN/HrcN family type III secretion system ATPase, partial [Planctomicrobium sp.]|nr:EscN/YscN/HrcN family type III secretion system ATPase [Planctomicrobium sp.]